MKYEFEKVVDGIIKYIDKEMLHEMNDVQEFFARVIVGRVLNNQEQIKRSIMSNGFLRTFGVIDSEGVDVDGLMEDLKREIQRQEKITFSIPMFGKITFRPSDVDELHKYIVGE